MSRKWAKDSHQSDAVGLFLATLSPLAPQTFYRLRDGEEIASLCLRPATVRTFYTAATDVALQIGHRGPPTHVTSHPLVLTLRHTRCRRRRRQFKNLISSKLCGFVQKVKNSRDVMLNFCFRLFQQHVWLTSFLQK